MIVSSTAPSRISLIGGGSDMPSFYQKHGGLVISMAINIYQRFEMYSDNDIYGIGREKNTVPEGGKLEFVYKILKRFNLNSMHHTYFHSDYDGVIESGLGASASAAVNIVSSINLRENLGYDRAKIAETAWDIEVNDLGLFGGKQDQYAAAFGGFNAIRFENFIELSSFSRKEAEKIIPAMVLFYIGENRKSAVIQEGFKHLNLQQTTAIKHLKRLAYDSIAVIYRKDVEKLGNLLNEAWEFKKKANKGVSNERIDKLYETGMKEGAWGGKICGAGGGGHMLFIIDPVKKKNLIEVMERQGLIWYDFNVDWNGVNSRILPIEK